MNAKRELTPVTIPEKITSVINAHVLECGTDSVMTFEELYDLVNSKFAVLKSSFLPQDYCYNRANSGIRFEEHVHLFERVEYGKYRLLGSHYPYTGLVYHRAKKSSRDVVVGFWNGGVFRKTV